jgi:hypothetical protein
MLCQGWIGIMISREYGRFLYMEKGPVITLNEVFADTTWLCPMVPWEPLLMQDSVDCDYFRTPVKI